MAAPKGPKGPTHAACPGGNEEYNSIAGFRCQQSRVISRINRRFMSVLVELEHPIELALGSGLHISNTVKRGVSLSGEILHGVFGVYASAWGGWGGGGERAVSSENRYRELRNIAGANGCL